MCFADSKAGTFFFYRIKFFMRIYILQPDKIKYEQIFEKSIAKQNKCSYNIFVIKLRNARRNEWCNILGIHCKGEVREEKYVYNTNRNDNRREIGNLGGCGQV